MLSFNDDPNQDNEKFGIACISSNNKIWCKIRIDNFQLATANWRCLEGKR